MYKIIWFWAFTLENDEKHFVPEKGSSTSKILSQILMTDLKHFFHYPPLNFTLNSISNKVFFRKERNLPIK